MLDVVKPKCDAGTMPPAKKTNRHGNLRAALVEAGAALVDAQGPDALSIRRLAAAAGVSHAAPGHHFPTLTDLRTAVAAEGFRRFAAAMEGEMVRVPPDPQARLDAACRGYIAFASRHPGLFHLILGGHEIDRNDPGFCAAAEAALEVLTRIAAPFADGPGGGLAAETMIWSQVHGFCGLLLAGRIAAPAGTDPADWFLSLPGRPREPAR